MGRCWLPSPPLASSDAAPRAGAWRASVDGASRSARTCFQHVVTYRRVLSLPDTMNRA